VQPRFHWPLALLAGATAVALAARVAVPLPFSSVPVSLQGLAVLLAGGLFGAAAGAGAMVLYLVLGALGLPVFAEGTSGLSHLFGPTGGYLFAFPLAAFATGRLAERGNPVRSLGAGAAGMLVLHLLGLTWLAVATGRSLSATVTGLAPVVWSDLAKVLLAGVILWSAAGTLRPRT
jgi:biotin transport system substrate-specific component